MSKKDEDLVSPCHCEKLIPLSGQENWVSVEEGQGVLNRGERAEWREARVYEDKTRGPHYKETQYTGAETH